MIMWLAKKGASVEIYTRIGNGGVGSFILYRITKEGNWIVEGRRMDSITEIDSDALFSISVDDLAVMNYAMLPLVISTTGYYPNQNPPPMPLFILVKQSGSNLTPYDANGPVSTSSGWLQAKNDVLNGRAVINGFDILFA